jgi:hypothetical protein
VSSETLLFKAVLEQGPNGLPILLKLLEANMADLRTNCVSTHRTQAVQEQAWHWLRGEVGAARLDNSARMFDGLYHKVSNDSKE